MLSETMNVRVEVWRLAADKVRLWSLDDEPWLSPNVPADDEPHSEVERHLAGTPVRVIHSTSWRVDGPAVIVTYLAVVDVEDMVFDKWPDAKPIPARLFEAVGKPFTHGATEPPVPRDIDVLLHGLRHLRFLMDHDDTTAAALDEHWRAHLAPLEPAIAAMYKAA